MLPSSTTYVQLAAGGHHSLARRSDGAVLAWGESGMDQGNVPAFPAGVAAVAISAGNMHKAALLADGTRVTMARYEVVGYQPLQASITPDIVAGNTASTVSLAVAASGSGPITYQWSKDDAVIAGATGATLTRTGLQLVDAGWYTCAVAGPVPPALVLGVPVYVAPSLGSYIQLSQPSGPGSLTFATLTGSAVHAGATYFNFVTFDSAAAPQNFFGIHAPLVDVLTQIDLGPPFFGVLDSFGNASTSVGPGTLSALAGNTLFVQGVILTPSGSTVGSSTLAQLTLQ